MFAAGCDIGDIFPGISSLPSAGISTTAEPTIEPTAEPTAAPTEEPSGQPTAEPSIEPTLAPGPDHEAALAEVSFPAVTVTYDGKEHKALLSGVLPTGYTVRYENNALTDAGTLSAVAVVSCQGEEVKRYEAKLTVNKGYMKGLVFKDTVFPYTGKAHALLVENLPEGAQVSYSDNTVQLPGEKKTAYATVTHKNYRTVNLSAQISVEANTKVLTVVAMDFSRTQYVSDPVFAAYVRFSDSSEVYYVEEGGSVPGVDGELTFDLATRNTLTPGEYALVPGGLYAEGYETLFIDGKLTVEEVVTDLVPGGYQIDASGNLSYNGKSVHMLGVNYFSMFNSCLTSGTKVDTALAFSGLAALESYGVKVLRFNCGLFYANEGFHYLDYKEAYYAALDAVLDECARRNIGVIPSFFWTDWYMDYYGESYYEAFNNPADNLSDSMAYIENYSEELVERYKNHPAIFGWEFGNERNLGNDIPHWANEHPGVDIKNKPTIAVYTKVLEHWSNIVYNLDPYHRLIMSGDAGMRPAQYHIYKDNTWTMDNYEEHKTIEAMHNSGYCHGISEHQYGGYLDESNADPNRLFSTTVLRGESILSWNDGFSLLMRVAKDLKKTCYVGECGVAGGAGITFTTSAERIQKQRNVYDAIAKAALDTGMPVTLYWNYDPITVIPEKDFADFAKKSDGSVDTGSTEYAQRGSGIEYSWNENNGKGLACLNAIKEGNLALERKFG